MEVHFMAEKMSFIQIVDISSGKIERIVSLAEVEALSPEDKLALSRTKNLFVVTHKLEPIVKVELKKTLISEPLYYTPEKTEEQGMIEEIGEEPIPTPKGKGKKKT